MVASWIERRWWKARRDVAEWERLVKGDLRDGTSQTMVGRLTYLRLVVARFRENLWSGR